MSKGRPKTDPAQTGRPIIIVTGSSGFIGSALIEKLKDDYSVVGFDSTCSPNSALEAEFVCVDLTSDKSVERAFKRIKRVYGHRIASVIHLAAFYDFSGEANPLYEEVTVRGTERLLKGLEGFSVEQFVFSSTELVHAPTEPGKPFNENWPLEPKWPYPESKVKTEKLIKEIRGNIPTVVLRIAGIYEDSCHSIPLSHQMQRIAERDITSMVFPGDVTHGSPFLHLDDLIDALDRTIQRRAQLLPETVLLLGEPETLSYDELQRTFARLIHGAEGEDWVTREIPKPLAKVGAWLEDAVLGGEPFIQPFMVDIADDHHELDISRARRLLGWEPKRRLRDALPKMAAELKSDPKKFYARHGLGPPPGAEEGPVPSKAPEQKEEVRPAPAEKGWLDKHEQMIRDHQEKMLWVYYACGILGLWLVASPSTLGYTSSAMTWSDILSGAVVAIAAPIAARPKGDFFGRWTICAIGLWLLFAPLVFWASSAAAYNNDTLIGALLVAMSVLIPMMPGRAHHMVMMAPGPDIPPGWSYNPSTWWQRAPIIFFALIAFFLSRYMAAYQLGHIGFVWDPFFVDGTRRVLESEVSRAWPISDAGLGAASYMLEALSGFMGGVTRWRTMPWMVIMFGILVIPLGATSIILIILQPLTVGAWCTLCLITAALMLIMIPPSLDEVLATVQFLSRIKRDGKPFWRTFWVGGTFEEVNKDDRSPAYDAPIRQGLGAGFWSLGTSWQLLACAAIGIWLMLAPGVFGIAITSAAADSDHVVGALAITFAVIATAEVARSLRLVNVILGLWLISSTWIFDGATDASRISDLASGLALAVLSIPKGRIIESSGGWERRII